MHPSALAVFLAIFVLYFGYIARYAPSIQRKTISKIHVKSFGSYYFTITGSSVQCVIVINV